MKRTRSSVKSTQPGTSKIIKESINGAQKERLVHDGDDDDSSTSSYYSSMSSSSRSSSSSSLEGSLHSVIDTSDEEPDNNADDTSSKVAVTNSQPNSTASLRREVTEADDNFFEYLETEVRSLTSEPPGKRQRTGVPQFNHLPSCNLESESPSSSSPYSSRLTLSLASTASSEEDTLSEGSGLQDKHSTLEKFTPKGDKELGHGINYQSSICTQLDPNRGKDKHLTEMADSDVELVTIKKKSPTKPSASSSGGTGSGSRTKRPKSPIPTLKEKEEMAKMVIDALMPYFRNKIILNEAEFKFLAKKLTHKALKKSAVRGHGKEKVSEYVDGKFRRVGVSLPK